MVPTAVLRNHELGTLSPTCGHRLFGLAVCRTFWRVLFGDPWYVSGLATRFVNVDRNTPMLLPPDLREWVPENDMVHFVIEAVAEMNLPTLKINRRGCGSEQYPPKMMLQLLIYCYATASSRRVASNGRAIETWRFGS